MRSWDDRVLDWSATATGRGAGCAGRSVAPRLRARRRTAGRLRLVVLVELHDGGAVGQGPPGRARTRATPASTRPSRPRWTRPSPATGSWSPPATTTRRPTARSLAADPAHGDSGGVHDHHARPPPAGHGPVHRGRRRHQAGLGQCSVEPGRPDLRRRSTRRQGRTAATASWCGRPTASAIDNLTACNFLGGIGRLGQRDLVERRGRQRHDRPARLHGQLPDGDVDLLRRPTTRRAQYGIFSSDSRVRPRWNQIYASNINDSGVYVGACQQVCGITINHAWMEYNALGYSGTNSGGAIVDRELAVRQQQGRLRHQHPDRRRPAARPRTAPARTAAPARSPTPTRAGCSCTTTSTTTTTRTCPAAGYAGQAPDRAPA